MRSVRYPPCRPSTSCSRNSSPTTWSPDCRAWRSRKSMGLEDVGSVTLWNWRKWWVTKSSFDLGFTGLNNCLKIPLSNSFHTWICKFSEEIVDSGGFRWFSNLRDSSRISQSSASEKTMNPNYDFIAGRGIPAHYGTVPVHAQKEEEVSQKLQYDHEFKHLEVFFLIRSRNTK